MIIVFVPFYLDSLMMVMEVIIFSAFFYLDSLMMMIVIFFLFHLDSLMRKGAVSTATFPSTDFCLVNGGPIVAFSSSYMPVPLFFCLLICLFSLKMFGLLIYYE